MVARTGALERWGERSGKSGSGCALVPRGGRTDRLTLPDGEERRERRVQLGSDFVPTRGSNAPPCPQKNRRYSTCSHSVTCS